MAKLTFDQATDQLKDVVHLLEELEKFAQSASPSYISLENTLKAGTIGDYFREVLNAIAPTRAAISGALSPANVTRHLAGALRDIGQAIGAPEGTTGGDPGAILDRLFIYMDTNSKTLNSRGITFGSPASVSPMTGSGSVTRITVDGYGYSTEACHSTDVKTLECILDQNQVDKHREIFEVRGEESEPDFLLVDGSGIVQRVRSLSSVDSQVFLNNPGFDTFTGTTPTASTPTTLTTTTQFSGWTVGTAANVNADIDTVYRTPVGVSTGISMNFTDNTTAEQIIQNTTRARIPTDVPFYVHVAVYREASCDGTLTIQLGGVSRAVTVSTLNNAAWNVVTLVATAGQNNWFRNWNQDAINFKLTLASRTTGTLYFDDVVMAPFTRVDGTYLAIVGGATPWKREDKFTITDSEATRGIMQYWIWRSGLGRHLPSTTSGETVTDP